MTTPAGGAPGRPGASNQPATGQPAYQPLGAPPAAPPASAAAPPDAAPAVAKVRPKTTSVAVLITPDMFAYDEDKRVDFEKGMRHAPPLTVSLMVVLTAIFVWEVAAMSQGDPRAVIDKWALVREQVLFGEWWRLFTAAMLHGGPDHLIGNLISLYILGIACEQALGAKGALILFAASAFGGSVLSIILSPGPSVGASGAIFGLMGGIILILHRNRNKLFVRDKRIGVVIAVWAGYTFFMGALSPMVDNGAHLGGMIAGALIAPLLPLRRFEIGEKA